MYKFRCYHVVFLANNEVLVRAGRRIHRTKTQREDNIRDERERNRQIKSVRDDRKRRGVITAVVIKLFERRVTNARILKKAMTF